MDCPQMLLAMRRCRAPLARAISAVDPVPMEPANNPMNQRM
jgi:hypothetical protein